MPSFKKKTDAIAKKAKKGVPAIPKFRPRQVLATQLASAGNTRFVRNSVNRFWFLLMGRGLVHPMDLMHKGNAASHPRVLDMLAREFVAHKFDVKWLCQQLTLCTEFSQS